MILPEDRGAIEALWIDHWYIYPTERLGEFEVCCQSSDERITDVGIYDGVEIVDQLPQIIERPLKSDELKKVVAYMQLPRTR